MRAISDEERAHFVAELLMFVRSFDPSARVSQRWGLTIVTSRIVPRGASVIFEPDFSVLADVES